MGENFVHIVIRPSTRSEMERVRKSWKMNHPDELDGHISEDKVIKYLIRQYFDNRLF